MDLILYQNHLALFALRPANLSHSDWEAIVAEIKAWCAPRYKTVELKSAGMDGGVITLNVTGNADPDIVMQELKSHLQECFHAVA